jgi:hypothetical protein
MAMGTPAFGDERHPPTESAIAAALGAAAGAWRALFEALRAEHPDCAGAWRYYADGKSWLFKVTRKRATVCWIAVEEGAFRVAFYFAERHARALLASELSAARKAEIAGRPPGGKLRAITVGFGSKRGVRDVMVLVGLKKSLR